MAFKRSKGRQAPSTKRVDKRQDRMIKKLIAECKPEIKVLQNNTNAAATTTAGAITCLTAMAQGVTQGTRVGMQQKNHRARERLFVTNTAVNGPNYCRVIYFTWKETSTPTVAFILESASIAATYNRLPANDDVYSIKKDIIIPLGPNLTPWTDQYYAYRDIDINLHGAVCRYEGTSNSAADAGSGHLWRLIISSSVSVTLADSYSYEYTDA